MEGDGDATDEDGTPFTSRLENLNAGAGDTGANGWRLPTFAELLTILEPDCDSGTCIDPIFGPIDTSVTPVRYYWSSTTDDFFLDAVWIVNFTGRDAYEEGKQHSQHARALRRGF
jgi:hypothetical protein